MHIFPKCICTVGNTAITVKNLNLIPRVHFRWYLTNVPSGGQVRHKAFFSYDGNQEQLIFIYVCIYLCRIFSLILFTQPLRSGRIRHKVNFVEKHSLSYYLPIAGERIIRFIPFPRVLVLCEMQSFSSKIWTRVTVSISYDDNHYTTGTSKYFH